MFTANCALTVKSVSGAIIINFHVEPFHIEWMCNSIYRSYWNRAINTDPYETD